jgi:hypothetical protein
MKNSLSLFTIGDVDYYDVINLLVKCFINCYLAFMLNVSLNLFFSFVLNLKPYIYNFIDESFMRNNFCHGILSLIDYTMP